MDEPSALPQDQGESLVELLRVAVSGIAFVGEVLAQPFIKLFQTRAQRPGDPDGSLNRRIPDPRSFPLVKSSD